jgi:hypothetical protein
MAIGTALYPWRRSRGYPKGQGHQNPSKAVNASYGLTIFYINFRDSRYNPVIPLRVIPLVVQQCTATCFKSPKHP